MTMNRLLGLAGGLAAALVALVEPASAQGASQKVTIAHAFAMHGDVKYGPDFKHFDYADPNAIKGGEVKYHLIGTFDSFNPWVLRGVPTGVVGATVERLMTGSQDEPFTEYCVVCETIEVPQDRSWVAFNLRPEARFHDGSPITADDVVWTFEALTTKGHPQFRAYYADVVKAEATSSRRVKFSFRPGIENRELPLIMGQLPVLSKAYWQGREFDKQTLDAPLGSGPYKIDAFEPGRYVTLRRVANHWGANLPVNLGQNNYDVIRYDYYRDRTVALEAFKAGEYDWRQENQALAWATRYDSPARAQGLYKLEEIPEERVNGMQGFVMNMRRPMFQDSRVREALTYAFDFEWSNKNLFHGAYTRTRSYFDNSELGARGLPSPEELKILDKFKGQISDRVFTQAYDPPKTDGTGNWRDNQRIATRLLREAGWKLENQRLVNAKGEQMSFEFLLDSPQFERIALPYVENLKRLGIEARVRTVDAAQYTRRVEAFDFDMVTIVFGQSESPGNEQRSYWTSASADIQGSLNLAGLKNPAVDQLVELLIQAPDRDQLVLRTRALDRVLQWSFLVVPHWHSRVDRVAYWDRFSRPKVTPKQGAVPNTWWIDPQKDAALRAKRG